MALVIAVALVLIVALSLGWNSVRPTGPPQWQAANLPLRLVARSGHTVVTLLYPSVSDYTLEVETALVSGPTFNGYGVIYQAQDDAHYTAFAISGDGYYAVLQVAGDDELALVDWQQFPHIHRGYDDNRLRVSCAGSTCQFFINDEYATSIDEGERASGDVGLWVRSFGAGKVTVEFAQARIWGAR
jgi:hypothetical protein